MRTRSFDLRRHQETRRFWTDLSEARQARDGLRLPSFDDFELVDLPAHLIRGCLLIDLGVVRPRPGGEGRPYFRFAGETHYNMLGFECTRHYLDDLPIGALVDTWRGVLETVARTREPLAGEVAYTDRSGRALTIHWLRLPLSRDGERVDMVLGHDVYEGPGISPSTATIRTPVD
jgi:hypothetical protein